MMDLLGFIGIGATLLSAIAALFVTLNTSLSVRRDRDALEKRIHDQKKLIGLLEGQYFDDKKLSNEEVHFLVAEIKKDLEENGGDASAHRFLKRIESSSNPGEILMEFLQNFYRSGRKR